MSRVLAVVAEACGLKPEMLKLDTHEHYICRPRQIVHWLLRKREGWSSSRIGRAVGWKDHSTVLYGVRRVEARRREDAEYREFVDALAARLDSQERAIAEAPALRLTRLDAIELRLAALEKGIDGKAFNG